MRFLVDANLPPALARWLESQGHDADHVHDLGMTASTDRAIWKHARDIGARIVTKDEDFVLLQALNPVGPAIAWIRIGNAVRSALLQRLATIWPSVVSAIDRGEKIVEAR